MQSPSVKSIEEIYKEIAQHVILGRQKECYDCTQLVISMGAAPKSVINDALIAGMDVVGIKFRDGEYFVPQVLLSARAMQHALEIIRPLLRETEAEKPGTVVLGVVRGDIHNIGKSLVGMMTEGAGYTIVDLGVNVPEEKFVRAIEEHKPQVLGMSALMTTTMIGMRETIQAVTDAGYREQVRIMVGGAPVNQRFANEIGADGYAPDATGAVGLVKGFMKEMRVGAVS